MEKLRTGIVGLGKVADFHALALAKLPLSEFVAVCGHTEEKTVGFARRYGVKPYTDLDKMLSECSLDVLLVCTPHALHADNVVKAAGYGCNCLVEKPLAITAEACDQIIAAAKEYKIQVGTVFQRRLYRPCMRIKQAIMDGRLDKLMMGTVNVFGWRDYAYYQSDPWRGTWKGEGGGVMATQASHQIDLLLWYMGEPEEVYGFAENYSHPYIEVEDTAIAAVRFKNGSIASLVMSNSQNPAIFGRVEVFGTNGAYCGVQTDGGAMFIAGVSEITEAPYNHLWNIPGEENMQKKLQEEDTQFFNSIDNMHYYHEQIIADFLDAVKTGRAPLVSAEEGKQVVALYNAIWESQRTNKPVRL